MSEHVKGILFVDVSPYLGDAQNNLCTVIDRLDKSKYQPFILCNNASPKGIPALFKNNKNIPIKQVELNPYKHRSENISDIIVDIFRIRPIINKMLKEYEIDVVYANEFYAALLTALSLPNKVPLLFRLRDYDCRQSATRHIVKRSSKTMIVSEFLYNHHKPLFDNSLTEKIATFGDGFGFENENRLKEKFSHRENYVINDDTILITMVGDMQPWHRHRLFLEAFSIAHSKNPFLFANIIGKAFDSESFDYLDGLVDLARELGIIGDIAFMEFVNNPFPIIDASNVIVSVAQNAPFGNSIIRALANNKPVVITSGGGPQEIMKDCDTARITADDPNDIADAILDTVTNKNGDKSTADKDRIIGLYSIDRQLENLYKVIDSCS